MNSIKLAPSMMCCDLLKLEDTLTLFEKENIEYLHIDVMDGSFVPNMMLGSSTVKQFRNATSIPLDFHLMTYEPEKMLAYYDIQKGDTVSVHIESTPHIHRILQHIRDCGAHPLVALNPGTPIESIREIVPYIEGVLLMTVDPGFAGQKMIPGSVSKVRRTKEYLLSLGRPDIFIEVDGGLGISECKEISDNGGNIFVLGTSGLFNGDLRENIHALRKL